MPLATCCHNCIKALLDGRARDNLIPSCIADTTYYLRRPVLEMHKIFRDKLIYSSCSHQSHSSWISNSRPEQAGQHHGMRSSTTSYSIGGHVPCPTGHMAGNSLSLSGHALTEAAVATGNEPFWLRPHSTVE